MNVKKLFSNYNLLICISLCFLFTGVFFLAKSDKSIDRSNKELQRKQSKIAMRLIGDHLLTTIGNYNEPLLPIKQVDSITFRLMFKESIVINPDSLTAASMKYINTNIAMQSIISVLDVKTKEVVYSFEINPFDKNYIPCLGRELPESDYWIDASFYNPSKKTSRIAFSILGFIGIVISSLFLFVYVVKRRKEKKMNGEYSVKGFKIIPHFNRIAFNNHVIQFTEKEMQIFRILFNKEGKLVTRESLIDEVWLKKGVVTTRSLDMYISRLRKKIKEISHAQIINHHGKGYVLEI